MLLVVKTTSSRRIDCTWTLRGLRNELDQAMAGGWGASVPENSEGGLILEQVEQRTWFIDPFWIETMRKLAPTSSLLTSGFWSSEGFAMAAGESLGSNGWPARPVK